jgi:hypothetical protein
LSGSAPSHRDRFSAAFITNIAESGFSARTGYSAAKWLAYSLTERREIDIMQSWRR